MTNLNMKRIHHKKYEAMGFVEALIAIIVVGVASVVLMQIAATTMSDAVENERIDKMTQYAIEGATMTENIVQEIYEFGSVAEISELNALLNALLTTTEKCFIPIIPDETKPQEFYFKLNGGVFEHYTYGDLYDEANQNVEKEYREYARISSPTTTDYFRYACIKPKGGTAKYLSVTIIVGHIPSEGTITARRNVKDYTYSTIINLNP